MREILFRAKRKDTVAWVEGCYAQYSVIDEDGDYTGETEHFILDKVCNMGRVYPDTICQYTGLKDMNGNKIWEKDIVNACDRIGVVKYEKCEFKITWISDTYFRDELWFWANERDLEVIGNVFDNPELLEEVSRWT